MKEHKIEILCQMEDERDSPVEHCNAGPEPLRQHSTLKIIIDGWNEFFEYTNFRP